MNFFLYLVFACLCALLLFAVVSDVKSRLIPNRVIAGLFAVRMIALLVECVLPTSFSERFGLAALGVSAVCALVLMAVLLVLEGVVRKVAGAEESTFGMGDVKLFAASCLFLDVNQVCVMLLVSSLFGVALALVYRFVKDDNTFPFAPAIAAGVMVAYWS